jgi:flavin reductase (DIM6/NTAB) family NADH-FMN oxidoreductase RutF
LWAVYDGGDHSIFVGEVQDAGVLRPGAPLVYHNRQWQSSQVLETLEEVVQIEKTLLPTRYP